MKIRTDFVTNSSSSSFIVDLTIENSNGEKYTLASFYKDYCDEGYSTTRTIGPKTLSGENGWDDPDVNFDTERWSWHMDDVDESINNEEADGRDRDLDPTEEDMHWREVLGLSNIHDVERVLNKMISGTDITDADENAIKSLIERSLEANNISLKEIDIYSITEELELSGENDMMEPSDFLRWDDALKTKNTDIEVLARRYKTDVESMRIFLDMRGHTYLTRRENIKNVRTGETFLRHIIYPTIYKNSRDIDPLPIPFYNNPSSSNEKSEVTDDKSVSFEDFEVSSNVLVKYLGKFEESVIIPRELGIKTIGEMAFADNKEITSVIIPEGVESIENYAFRFAGNIKEIRLPNTLVRIAESAFLGCHSLSKINIPDNCIDFSLDAFRNTDITFDKLSTSRIKLDLNGFLVEYTEQEDCNEELVLPEYIIGILPGAFSKIKAARKIVINHHCKLSEGVFEGIACLEEADISALRFETVPAKLFKNCTSLKRVALPNELYVIEKDAFSNCTELCEINLSDKLLYIDKTAFLNCNKLTGNLKSKIEEIASLPHRLKNVVEDTKKYIRTHGWLSFRFNASNDTFAYLFETKSMYKKWHKIFDNAFAFDRPDSLRKGNIKFTIWADKDKINRFLKKHSQKLSELMWKHTSQISGATDYLIVDTQNIPTVDRTFYKYSLLESGNADKASSYGSNLLEKAIAIQKDGGKVQIMALLDFTTLLEGKKVDRINKCKNLWDEDIEEEKFVVPTQNVSLGSEEIYISPKASVAPETILKTPIADIVKSAGSDKVESLKEVVSSAATAETSSPTTSSVSSAPKVELAKETTPVKATSESPAEDFEIKGTVLVKYNGTSAIVAIPEKIEEIGASAFAGNQKIEEVILHDKVKKISSLAFSGCGKLRAVSLGYGLQSIEDHAFSECYELDSIVLTQTVQSIGNGAFYDCKKLRNILIPNSVKTIGEYAFYNSGLNSILIPDSVTSVQESSFSYSDLEKVIVGKGLKELRGFSGCKNLTEIVISRGVLAIKQKCFRFCKKLKKVHLPSTVTKIENYAFEGCGSSKLNENEQPLIVYISDSVTKISQYAFGPSPGLDAIKFITTRGSCADKFAHTNNIDVSYDYTEPEMFDECTIGLSVVDVNGIKEDHIIVDNVPSGDGDNVVAFREAKELYNAGRYSEALKAFEQVESDYLDVASLRAECRIKLEEEKSNSNAYETGKSLYKSGKYQEALTVWAILSDTYRDVKTMREKCRQQLAGMASVTVSTASTPSGSNTAIPKHSKALAKPKISKTTKIAIAVGVVLTILAIIIFSVIHANSDESLYAWEELSDGTIQINGIEEGKAEKLIKDGVLTIPSEIDGKRVTVISGNSYFDNDYEGATKIVVPEGVVTIGEYAFRTQCVTEIVLPSTLKHINDNAFKNCDLETVILPSGLKTIGTNAFYNCKMSSVSIPGGVTQIGDAAFYGCDNLTSISITNGVEVVGKEAFAYCNSLSKVTLGNTIKTLEQGAFKSIPASTIDLPASLTTIGDSVFEYCNNLSIVMPDNLVNVGKRAFDVKSVKFNKNVKTFDIEWFDSWSIPLISVDSSNKYLCTIDGVLYDYNKTIAYVATDKTITNINLPNTLKTISDECFRGCKNLITIELPFGLTSIGREAFSNCTAIKELYIPDSVISVGSQILYNCKNAIIKCAEADKPSGWSDSFNEYGYKDLKVYWNSGKLSGETNGFVWRTSADGELIIDSYNGNASTVIFPVVEGYTLLKVPSQLFYNHSEIKYLTIPSSVTEIGYAALYGCNGLTSLTLPSVCSIVELFNTSSTSWARVSTPESLKTITFNGGEKIFSSSLYNCTHIENVTIPTTIKSIGTNAFAGCISLTYVKFASPTGWKYRTYSYTYGESFYQISESSLSSTSNAATLLKDTYDSYEWRKD